MRGEQQRLAVSARRGNFKGYDGQYIYEYIFYKACIKPSVIMNER